MKILLSNDDGFYAEGIQVLEKALAKAGHEVWVCAPESQRSARSHAITIGQPVTIKEIRDRHYTCSGNPADCIMYFMHCNRSGRYKMGQPDLIIAGINDGYNMSNDVIYSGTVGAATEGTFFGIPSIALSAEDSPNAPFQDAADFLVSHLETIKAMINKGSYININVPKNSRGQWEVCKPDMSEFYGHKITETSKDVFNFTGTPNKERFTQNGSVYKQNPDEITDIDVAVVQNKIAVSAIKVIPIADEQMQKKLQQMKQTDIEER